MGWWTQQAQVRHLVPGISANSTLLYPVSPNINTKIIQWATNYSANDSGFDAGDAVAGALLAACALGQTIEEGLRYNEDNSDQDQDKDTSERYQER